MLRIIIAIILIAHGIGHVMGFMASWTTIPSGMTTGQWILPGDVTLDSIVGRVFGLLWLVAMVGTVGAGLGLLFEQEWWQPLAIASATISLVAIVPWISLMPPMSALGAVAIDIVVIVVLATPWGERFITSLP